MHFDTDGIYTLQYTAEDSCGNETIEEREVEVYSLKTVLYTDGTFIINERSIDRDANIALHGAVTNEYRPLDESYRYTFANRSDRPWNSQVASIKRIEIGSNIAPENMRYWFYGCSNVREYDFSNLDTSSVLSMYSTFTLWNIDRLDLSSFDTHNVTDMSWMFANATISEIDMSSFDTNNLKKMNGMFRDTIIETIDISSFDFTSLTDFSEAFRNINLLTSQDILTTIIVKAGTDISSISGASAFSDRRNLVGGNGTVYSSSYYDSQYARIDNPPDAPGYFTAKA